MPVEIEVGQVWSANTTRTLWRVSAILSHNIYGYAKVMATEIIDDSEVSEVHFVNVDRHGYTTNLEGTSTIWSIVKDYKPKSFRKVIPGIPLDPSLPILQAGHLQDRQRKKYGKNKP